VCAGRAAVIKSRQTIRRWPIVALGAFLLAATAAVVVAATGAARPADASAAQAEIRALVIMRDRALVDADMAALKKIHASDYQLITPDGSVLSRAGFLHSVASGDLNYLTFRPVSHIQVLLLGNDAAAVRYESKIDIVVAGIGRLTNENWHTDLYERRSGHWQVAWSQTTPIGGLPTPTAPPS
jgi:hypothetical protein